MKKCQLILLILGYAFILSSQAPGAFNYQGVARFSDGSVISEQNIGLRISIINSSSGIQTDFEEEHQVTTNAYGLFQILIGQGTNQSGNLENIDWEDGNYEIGIEIDVSGSGSYTDLGNTPLYSVPYALYANQSGNQFWSEVENNDDGIFYAGNIELRSDGNPVVDIGDNIVGAGFMESFNQAGERLFQLTSTNNGASGRIELFEQSNIKNQMAVFPTGEGYLSLFGADNQSNINLTSLADSPNIGFITINGNSGDRTVGLLTNVSSNAGWIFTEGPNGNFNVNISNFSGNDDRGYMSVNDENGTAKAGLFVNDVGNGVLFADIVNTVSDHPNKSNQQISYSMLEGPEAAAYIRGTATLVNGIVEVNYPEHFGHKVNAKTITVMLTPLSAESRGLAVVEKVANGFTVQELMDGKGNYSFDWEVKGIRKGFEEYQVVQTKSTTFNPVAKQQSDILQEKNPER